MRRHPAAASKRAKGASNRARGTLLDARHALALDHHLAHPALTQAFVIVTSLDRASPKKYQRHVRGVDGAVRPIRSNVRDLAGCQFSRAGGAVLAFEQDQPVAAERLVDLRVIAFAMVMAAGQVVFALVSPRMAFQHGWGARYLSPKASWAIVDSKWAEPRLVL